MRERMMTIIKSIFRPWVLLVLVGVLLLGVGAFSPSPAWADDPNYTPEGIGSLISNETDILRGNSKTLYEAYEPGAFMFDTNLGNGDILEKTFNGLANFFQFLSYSLARGAIVIVWTMLSFANTEAMTAAVATSMGAAATALLGWLLPIALAVGGVIAFVQHRQGSGFSQLVWVFTGGLLAVSFAVSPTVWVDGVNGIRVGGSELVMNATSSAMTTTDTPFPHEPAATYNGNTGSEEMLRKSTDSIWRAYVVTPWCMGEFGSTAGCTKWGSDLLANGGVGGADMAARDKWLWENVKETQGEESGVWKWVAGHSPIDRLGMSVITFLVNAIFSIMILVIAFTALFAFVSSLMLLLVGVFFVMLWCIPGRTREWGTQWFATLLGTAMQSVIATLVISAVLALTTAALSLTSSMGWGAAAAMSILVAVSGFTLRRTLATIMQMMIPGSGMTTALGFLAMRGASRLGGKGLGMAKRGVQRAGRLAGRGAAGSAKLAGRGAIGAGKLAGRGISQGVGTLRNRFRHVPPPGQGAGSPNTQPSQGSTGPTPPPRTKHSRPRSKPQTSAGRRGRQRKPAPTGAPVGNYPTSPKPSAKSAHSTGRQVAPSATPIAPRGQMAPPLAQPAPPRPRRTPSRDIDRFGRRPATPMPERSAPPALIEYEPKGRRRTR